LAHVDTVVRMVGLKNLKREVDCPPSGLDTTALAGSKETKGERQAYIALKFNCQPLE